MFFVLFFSYLLKKSWLEILKSPRKILTRQRHYIMDGIIRKEPKKLGRCGTHNTEGIIINSKIFLSFLVNSKKQKRLSIYMAKKSFFVVDIIIIVVIVDVAFLFQLGAGLRAALITSF